MKRLICIGKNLKFVRLQGNHLKRKISIVCKFPFSFHFEEVERILFENSIAKFWEILWDICLHVAKIVQTQANVSKSP